MTATPVRPPRVVRTLPVLYCGAGVKPCGEPGRLYPCGVRCDLHSPNEAIRAAAWAAQQPGTDGGPGSEEVRAA